MIMCIDYDMNLRYLIKVCIFLKIVTRFFAIHYFFRGETVDEKDDFITYCFDIYLY